MKLIIVLAFVALAAARPDDDYSRYEDFNVDEVIENKRLFKAYVECFLGNGKCTPEGNDFKKWIPEAIQNDCSKCSEKQKGMIAKIIVAAQNQHADDWQKLNARYNPDGKRDNTLKEFIKKYGN